jgi:thioredoxin-like negative regulator of GroEL
MVKCATCGTLNKVPADKEGSTGKCGQCGGEFVAHKTPGKAFDVGDADFHIEVLDSPVPVLLEFWAPSCGHCVSMAQVLDELAGDYRGRLKVAKMDVMKNRRIPADFEVRGTPMFVLFKGGRPATRFVGSMPKSEIISQVEPHL